MKKIFILLLVSTLGLSSCKDFLTVVPTNALFLEDVKSLKQTLSGYLVAYLANQDYSGDAPNPWLEGVSSQKYISYSDVWTFNKWQNETLNEQNKRLLDRAVINENEWERHYKIIGFMNLILSEIDDARGKDEDMRNYVKGEALVHRAFSFLKLLQLYAPVKDASLGIPVYLDIYGSFGDADLQRKPHSVVYDRILTDLKTAEELLGVTAPSSTFNVMYSYDYVYRIMAQVYRWKAIGAAAEPDDWANAADAALKAIAATDNALPTDITTLTSYTNPYFTFTVENNRYPEMMIYMTTQSPMEPMDYDAKKLTALYNSKDLRLSSWFDVTGDVVTSKKYGKSYFGLGAYVTFYFRLCEQYMILMEAYAHTDLAEGLDLLDMWRGRRYAADAVLNTPTTAEELLSEVRLERKREFFMEGDFDWLDMKCYGYTGSGRSVAGYVSKPLEADDIRYQFMIPDYETETNISIRRNPGWEEYRIID